ncbi:hypothetical protein [Rhodanobacter sp. MP7CTX1]|uniref:hypothetical protein n=1 Tax=Rhodanobacter sp. MP7CTX1 TaxID=2723084 RepID=UPI001616BED7|nr:hypothetical protein [Rhodanobacter sp. MP7CTX1]MBB6187640.1 hypothetical protein [Rhodanobacter sp. MP7CTX1]
MKIWQVPGQGEGFVRGGKTLGFELSGLVSADGPNEAFEKAISLAEREWPDICQAETKGIPHDYALSKDKCSKDSCEHPVDADGPHRDRKLERR